MKSNQVESIGVRLRQFWLADGNPVLQSPATAQEILSFEQNNNIVMPPDFAMYLKCQNGFDQYSGHQDAMGFNFWPLQDMASLDVYDGGQFRAPGYSSYFLFCDYLDFSWGYALCMEKNEQKIVLVGARDGIPKVVAESFSSFVDAYLRDAPSIYL